MSIVRLFVGSGTTAGVYRSTSMTSMTPPATLILVGLFSAARSAAGSTAPSAGWGLKSFIVSPPGDHERHRAAHPALKRPLEGLWRRPTRHAPRPGASQRACAVTSRAVKPNREDSGHRAVARCRVPAADKAS